MNPRVVQRFKSEYLGNAIAFEIVLFIFFFIIRLGEKYETWYDPFIFAFCFSTILTLAVGGLGFAAYEIIYPHMQKTRLRHPSLVSFFEQGFVANEAEGHLGGTIDGFYTRIYWLHFNERNPKTHGLYIDIFFREDLRRIENLESAKGCIWYLGFLRSVLEAGYRNLPSYSEIDAECNRMTAQLRKNRLTPIEIGEWTELWKPQLDQIAQEKKESQIKKRINFLGLKIDILKKGAA